MKPVMYHSPSEGERWDASFHDMEIIVRENEFLDQGWCRIKDIASIRKEPPSEDIASFQYIDIESVDTRTGYCYPKTVGKNSLPSRAKRTVRTGDVIVSLVRPGNGCVLWIDDQLDGAIASTGFVVLDTNSDLAGAWLLHGLLLPSASSQMNRRSRSTMYPTLNPEDVLDVLIPPMDKEEARVIMETQRRLGEIMNQAIDLRGLLTGKESKE